MNIFQNYGNLPVGVHYASDPRQTIKVTGQGHHGDWVIFQFVAFG
jgi:hypothetical protein